MEDRHQQDTTTGGSVATLPHTCEPMAYLDCAGCGKRQTWCCHIPEPDRAAIQAARVDPERGFRCRKCRS